MKLSQLAAMLAAAALALGLVSVASADPPGGSWVIDFEKNLSAGDTPSVLNSGNGVSGGGLGGQIALSSSNAANPAMIFDSDCSGASCSGGDDDLDSQTGNVLIISEDNDPSDPDDRSMGGVTLTFDFSNIGSVCIDALTVTDIEANNGVFGLSGSTLPLTLVPQVSGGDGVTIVTPIDVCGVEVLTWTPNESGSIDNIEFSSDRDFMTGGGNITNGERGRAAVDFSTHGFIIRCDGSHANFQYNDHINGGGFHLESVTSVVCFDDPELDPTPPGAGFDTLTLIGTGRWNPAEGPNVEATVIVTMTDDGQPGTGDYFDIVVFNGGPLSDIEGFLTVGNHQAH